MRWGYRAVGPCFLTGQFILGAPPLGLETNHAYTKTVPCYRFLKGCTLDCPRCKFKRQFTVYVPIIDIGLKKDFRIVITGGKKTWQSVQGAKVGDVIALNKGEEKKDTVLIRAWPNQVDERTLRHYRSKCIEDISLYLFHLWQCRELTEHFGLKYYPSLRIIENAGDYTPPQCDRPDDSVPE